MRVFALILLAALATPAHAAVPPSAQNLDDLQTMVNFIAQHGRLAEELRSIDLKTYTIHFGDDCEAFFVRGEAQSEMPGPAPDLVFDRATCDID